MIITPECGCEIPVAVKPIEGLSTYHGASNQIVEGGVSQIAVYAPLLGGTISNPATSQDQGAEPIEEISTLTTTKIIGAFNTYALNRFPSFNNRHTYEHTYEFFGYGPPEVLYVCIGGPAQLNANQGTFALLPGQRFNIPVGCTLPIYVNSKLTGHKFTAIAVQPPTQQAVPYSGAFPPATSTNKQTTIPAYLYKQYDDDPDLPAFIDAYNAISQSYLDWFNTLDLPIYTSKSDAFLDWIAEGLYGFSRPTLYSGRTTVFGPFDTYAFNSMPFNKRKKKSVYSNIAVTDDDTFKRIITWHLYRGDGRNMNVRWLKRRIVRFLNGVNGGDYNGDTNNVSVSIANGYITITLISGLRRNVKSAAFNRMGFNTTRMNSSSGIVDQVTLPKLAVIFEEAINTGALEMPDQYTSVCRIATIGAVAHG